MAAATCQHLLLRYAARASDRRHTVHVDEFVLDKRAHNTHPLLNLVDRQPVQIETVPSASIPTQREPAAIAH